ERPSLRRVEAPQVRHALDGGASGSGDLRQEAIEIARAARVDDPLIGRLPREARAVADHEGAAAGLAEALGERATDATAIREDEPWPLLSGLAGRRRLALSLLPADAIELLRFRSRGAAEIGRIETAQGQALDQRDRPGVLAVDPDVDHADLVVASVIAAHR